MDSGAGGSQTLCDLEHFFGDWEASTQAESGSCEFENEKEPKAVRSGVRGLWGMWGPPQTVPEVVQPWARGGRRLHHLEAEAVPGSP